MPSFTVFKGSKGGAPVKSTTTEFVQVKVTVSGLCGTGTSSYLPLRFPSADRQTFTTRPPTWASGTRASAASRPSARPSRPSRSATASAGATSTTAAATAGSASRAGFATRAVWKESFLFKIPDSISDVDAAPLQCAGATVFAALQGVGSSDVVGVMGVGGLGHRALQFAHKLGCRVVVLSGSERKKDEAIKLGATDFVATADAKELKVEKKITRLLVTTSAQPDWAKLTSILDMRATVYPLSVDEGDFSIPYMPLLLQGITVQGSVVAARAVHRDMLEFAGHHGIKPICQTFPMTEEGIKEAMDKLDKGEVRYRAVLVNDE